MHLVSLRNCPSRVPLSATRTFALHTHPPTIIFAMLFVVALASALLAGHGLAGGTRRNWLHMVGFAAIIAVAVYVILNLEFPRRGLFESRPLIRP